MVVATYQFGNCLMEKLDGKYYYLVNKVPVVTNLALENLSESDRNMLCDFVQHVWQPEFVLMYSDGAYHKTGYVKPYVFCDGHKRVGNACVHYNTKYVDICSDDAVQTVKQISEQMMRSAVNVCFVCDHVLSCNYMHTNEWTDEMRDIFFSLDGDYSWMSQI